MNSIVDFKSYRENKLHGYDIFFKRIIKLVKSGEMNYDDIHITTTREIILTSAINNLPKNYDFTFPYKLAKVIDIKTKKKEISK